MHVFVSLYVVCIDQSGRIIRARKDPGGGHKTHQGVCTHMCMCVCVYVCVYMMTKLDGQDGNMYLYV